jgi:hypothetical protein
MRPLPVASRLGDERSGARLSVVIVAGRHHVTVSADPSAIRTGAALSINQVIDLAALAGASRGPDLRLAQALS